ncbi:MAG: sulfide/dihydroorotate dehydrogenase-like FAD/NAD-binding protein [Nitrososphaerota archaeon]|nr:sulfide/dihydroorotate dehydrogenase-like FAD/NAD-binding protein [Candidatus Bathyarchaeota archaeon]MDW8048726.1 sulfide/dihydroorotate dehydrogenase-like FAD/NAD-binding protein [Nitrososphaerota archaeon]
MAKKFKILQKTVIAPEINRMEVYAPLIAKKAQAGQFVILRVDELGERFPLTLVDWDPAKGTIALVFQEVGVSTKKLGRLKAGDYIEDIVGPLGNPTDIRRFGSVAVVGGGVGAALIYPWIKALKKADNYVLTILGARNFRLLLFEDELKKLSNEIYVSTDDGSRGIKGFTSEVLRMLIENGRRFDLVMAAGPVQMMKAVAEVTRPYNMRTIVSLNPIMVDGTGMCGSCRIMVGGEVKFACVDGPEFDAHKVDFNDLINRLNIYKDEETRAARIFEDRQKNAFKKDA